jgi:SAP domain
MTDWSKLKVVDLKVELKRRGLVQGGIKADMVARLVAFEAQEAEAEAEATASPPDPSDPTDEDKEFAPGVAEPELAPAAEQSAASGDRVSPSPTNGHVIPKILPEAVGDANPNPEPTSVDSDLPNHADPTPTKLLPIDSNSNDVEKESLPNPTVQDDQVAQDSQKRKRLSASPLASPERMTNKRARKEDSEGPRSNMEGILVETKEEKPIPEGIQALPVREPPVLSANGHEQLASEESYDSTSKRAQADDMPYQSRHVSDEHHSVDDRRYDSSAMEYERAVEPSLHPATSALYIRDFMRPLRPDMVREHLLNLATPPSKAVNPDDILDFYLDQIRTHAFVVFNTLSAAARVRTALHNTVWPDEANRKKLWVDFVPSERVSEWIRIEQTQGGGRGSTGARWEVIYDRDEDGNITVDLDSAGGGRVSRPAIIPPADTSRAPMPVTSSNHIPLGPRAQRGLDGVPVGPRGSYAIRMGLPGTASRASGTVHTTIAGPPITYQMVPDDLVERRLANIRSYETKDPPRDLGTEKNRYYFEDGDKFVDRGKEVFEGIRPPHREAEVQERRRQAATGAPSGRRPDYNSAPPRRRYGGGGGGRGSYRARSPLRRVDSYYPDRETDRVPRYSDDRGSRYRDDRRGVDSYRDYRDRR